MNTNSCCCLLLLIASLRLAAQQDVGTLRMQRLDNTDGMSHRWALCVHQDTQGYFWIGTYDGLNRYDGNEFQVFYPSKSGLPSDADYISHLAELVDGTFFLETRYGILHFDPVKASYKLVQPFDKESAVIWNTGRGSRSLEASYHVWAYQHAPLNIYWLEPTGKMSLKAKITKPSNEPLYLVLCTENDAWFWNAQGAYWRYDFRQKTWHHFPVAGSMEVPIDMAGRLWLPEGKRLRSFQFPTNASAGQWQAFHNDLGGQVWLIAKNKQDTYSLYYFQQKSGRLELVIPSSNEMSGYNSPLYYFLYRLSPYRDADGIIWFPSFTGLQKIWRVSDLFHHYLAKPVEEGKLPPLGLSARHLSTDKAGNIYLRDNDNFVHKINLVSGAVQPLNPPALENDKQAFAALSGFLESQIESRLLYSVFALTADPEGFIWMRTPQAFFRYDPVSDSFQAFRHPGILRQFMLHDDGRGRLWSLVGNDTLCLFDKKTGMLQPAPRKDYGKLFFSAMMPEENTLWGFTDTGLVKINTLNFDTRFIRLYDQPREHRCLVSHRGYLWLGTSRGLEKVDPTTFAHTHFDRSDGLAANFIYSIVADGNYLWLGTADGLCQFNIETGTAKNFYAEDGLSHNEFNTFSTLKTPDGRIYMGGLNGINGFLPADFENKTDRKAHIMLSGFSLYDEAKGSTVYLLSSQLAEGIELAPSVTSFNFHLALTDFLEPAKNQFAWRMEGLDNDWYYAGRQHLATYRQIPAGTYVFRAKAADAAGNWSENELAIRITVLPPWWRTWWAVLLYTVAGSTMIFFYYKTLLRQRLERQEALRLRELDTFKNRFFTNITHEFRTPLTVIAGMAEEIEKQPAIAKQLILRNARNLLRLVNQMLDLSKLESGKLKIHWQQSDVVAYLQYLTEAFRSYADSKKIQLTFYPEANSLHMDFDPGKLQHIVSNLLSNAIKFTPEGGKIIFHVASQDDKELIIKVKDTGVGILPKHLPHVFDRFYQVDGSHTRKGEGTGIGLALTKELVELVGGSISVKSSPGTGSEFKVVLPVRRSLETVGSEQLAVDSGVAAGLASATDQLFSYAFATEDEKDELPLLLLVEDNADVATYIQSCLQGQFKILYAENGQLGIDKAIETVPDIVISDVMMPEKDGFELTAFLKNDERTSHIPIVLLTAKADVESRIAGLRRGADAYLAKPFHREELLVTLQNLLELRQKLQEKYRAFGLETKVPSASSLLPSSSSLEDAFLTKLLQAVERRHAEAGLTVEDICRVIGMSKSNLHRKLVALTGLSFIPFLRSYRLERAKSLLQNSQASITEIAFQVGFDDPKYFSRVFGEQFGLPPSEVRKA